MQQQKTTDIFIKCAHMNILNHETYMFQARVHGCPAHWSPDVRPRKKTSGSQVMAIHDWMIGVCCRFRKPLYMCESLDLDVLYVLQIYIHVFVFKFEEFWRCIMSTLD